MLLLVVLVDVEVAVVVVGAVVVTQEVHYMVEIIYYTVW